MIKKAVLVLMCMAALAACATTKQYAASGGSRADGTVKLSYEYWSFERPVVDSQQGLSLAQSKCAAWGYNGAEPFGAAMQTCTAYNASGCARMLVITEYQCLGGPER